MVYNFDHLSLFLLFELTASLNKYENIVKVLVGINSKVNVNSKYESKIISGFGDWNRNRDKGVLGKTGSTASIFLN